MEGLIQDPTITSNHCVNWDLLDPSQQTSIDVDTLEYEDAPEDDPFPESGPVGPIQETLTNSISSVSTRTKDAEALFRKISSAIDIHCSSASRGILPERQYLAFKSFCQDFAKVAASHFDTYICDKAALISTLNGAIRDINPPTFASVTRQAPAKCALRGTGKESSILTNVQSIKTGFALYPKDGETAKLKEKLATVSLYGDAPVENAEPWISYRIENVTCTYGVLKLINDEWKYCLEAVSATAKHEAPSAAAGVAPMAIQASRNNDSNQTSSSTALIARFPESHQRLPRTLFLFGCRTQAKPPPRRRTTAQCSRCWLWHNTRACASDPKYRLCGSSNHSENQHSNNCAVSGAGHTCPNRCINCHGLYPANDSTCELRLKASIPPLTKAQVSSVRCVCAAARLHNNRRCASELTEAIRSAYAAAARRSLGFGKGNASWDTSCKLARQKYKKVCSGPMTEDDAIRERNEYRRTIIRAKKAHFIKKAAAAASGKDIFALTKWHKSTGNFRSNPLKDPMFPDRPPATSLPVKREIPLGNLLTNLAEVGDIPQMPRQLQLAQSRSLHSARTEFGRQSL
ncbi:hypothetical protein K3495_g13108 [Podosphaera aphanis]|nr:hypothetical protein K3495_g13108 [Podosphaera aphanis]